MGIRAEPKVAVMKRWGNHTTHLLGHSWSTAVVPSHVMNRPPFILKSTVA